VFEHTNKSDIVKKFAKENGLEVIDIKIPKKLKIAFDCSGTIMNGPDKVLKLFEFFEKKGAELIVWSNSYGYCIDVRKWLGERAAYGTKTTKWDFDCSSDPESWYVDIAVDDDSEQTYLAAKAFIWVRDIPDDPGEFEAKYGYMFEQR
jgi:hypothetical protein